jgi:hypothetical protein
MGSDLRYVLKNLWQELKTVTIHAQSRLIGAKLGMDRNGF